MNGDLGNLLTGEMGEAEARFAHEDFAEEYGRRVAGRVRRRRAVRAVGVGGGTMLTAGALVVGATHMPWGVLGAAPGEGGTDCVTPSPSAGDVTMRVTFDGSDGRPSEIVLTDPSSGVVTLYGVEQPDGTYLFTDAAGNQLTATPGANGSYIVNLPDASTGLVWSSPVPADPSTGGTFTYTVEAPAGAAVPSASDDCYTPSPTPSAAPSLPLDPVLMTDLRGFIKPDDVIGDSPFECGFTFPTDSYGSDALSIDGAEWFTPAEVDAQYPDTAGRSVSWGSTSRDALVPRVTVHHDMPTLAEGETATGVVDTGEPSLEKLTENPANASSVYNYSKGRTFVGVKDGKVVATGTFAGDDATVLTAIFTARDGFGSLERELIYLIEPGVALTSCDADPVDLAQVDIVAVAGLLVKNADGTANPTVYAWLPVGKP